MENLESIWQVGLLAMLAGAMIGALAYRLFAPSMSKANKVRSELEASRQELIDYKASVNSHFDKTAELVNDLTQNYVKVYQHLAEGAQNLGGSRELNNLLEQQQGKVMLAVDDESSADRVDAAGSPIDSSPLSAEAAEGAKAAESIAAGDETESRSPDAGAETKTPGDEEPTPEAAADTQRPRAGEQSADQAAAADATTDSAGSEQKKSGDPVIDVSKIEQDAATEARKTELGTLIPEPRNGDEIKPTRH